MRRWWWVAWSPCTAALATLRLRRESTTRRAGRVYLRSIEIKERALDPDHPEVAAGLNNVAGILRAQVR